MTTGWRAESLVAPTILIVLGIAFLCILPLWTRLLLTQQASADTLTMAPIPSAFDEDPEIPSEEFRAKFNRAVTLLDAYRVAYQRLRKAQQFADWIAFTLTSLITVLAGYLGRGRLFQAGAPLPPPSNTTGRDETMPAVATVEHSPLQASRRSKRLVAFIGVMAALASTSTGLSNRLDAQAEKRWKQAADLTQNLSSIRIEWYNGKSKEDALRVLGKLDSYNLNY